MATGATRVEVDPAGIGDMLNESWLYAALDPYAERVLASAQGSESDYVYRIEHVVTDRCVVRVGSDDPGALFEEAYEGTLIRALGGA